MAAPNKIQPACLVIIDGWGVSRSESTRGNAVRGASTPVMDELCSTYPFTVLHAHGRHVGLPDGQIGSSEVGHMHIGAGRVILQDIARITQLLESGDLERSDVFQQMIRDAQTNKRLHLVGLVSPGGVHSTMSHAVSIAHKVHSHGVKVFVHAITDGRDVAPNSAAKYLDEFMAECGDDATVVTVMGRYYAMDRDCNAERTKKATDALISRTDCGEPASGDEIVSRIQARYASGEYDEFITPMVFGMEGRLRDGDTVLTFNFRADRMLQLCQALNGEGCGYGDARPVVKLYTMTRYNTDLNVPVLVERQSLKNGIAEVLSDLGVDQLHVAESEKKAHVSYFFDGQRKTPYRGESFVFLESPKVETFDLEPEMRTADTARAVVSGIDSGKVGFVVCNFAAPDMVGHTGNYDATVRAVEAVDRAIGEIWRTCEKAGWVLVVTADHGNAEAMVDKSGDCVTAHTTNEVPFVATTRRQILPTHTEQYPVRLDRRYSDHDRSLTSVAPSVLSLMCAKAPGEMTGMVLFV